MTPERWQRIETVLQAALDCSPAERAALISESCAGDEELQAEANSLITAHNRAADFLEQPAIAQDAHIFVGKDSQTKIGLEVGPYKIVERLGGGGMGDVYLAQDVRLNRRVALKILPAHFVSDDQRLHRFQTEARAASALNHPNILTIYEVGEFDSLHFIATEFIEGQTIRELTASRELSLGEIFEAAIQVVSGLSAAHAAGIVHRDIKPENIMRRADGIVKILDFGIAKLTEAPRAESSPYQATQTEIGIVLGTVGYMSPEQMRGLAVDQRTDIWSAGVVLYEMLTGHTPFAGPTRADTMVAILEREPAPMFEGNAQPWLQRAQQVTSKALRKETPERYQSATEMLTDLKAIKKDLEVGNVSAARLPIDSLTLPHEIGRSSAINTESTQRYWYRHSYLILGLVFLIAIASVLLYQRSRLRTSINVPSAPFDKLYTQMNQTEQLAFINDQEERIAAMMGDRPVKLNSEALLAIKQNIDHYAARQASASNYPGRESLRIVYGRASTYVPLISRSFRARKIPILVGIYLPMIESEYKPCYENSNGAKGLFQFLPQTAQQYGVEPAEMCDAEKMTPAAAHYIADRMAELGDDSQSMTLVLLSYNRGAEAVRESLRTLRESGNYERNFWMLFANRDKLDSSFQNESAWYVPAFFAAAIIGENPRNFDLPTPALSSLADQTE